MTRTSTIRMLWVAAAVILGGIAAWRRGHISFLRPHPVVANPSAAMRLAIRAPTATEAVEAVLVAARGQGIFIPSVVIRPSAMESMNQERMIVIEACDVGLPWVWREIARQSGVPVTCSDLQVFFGTQDEKMPVFNVGPRAEDDKTFEN